MAKEILAISEDFLEEFIEVLERGIIEQETSGFEISYSLKSSLIKWIEDERDYLKKINSNS